MLKGLLLLLVIAVLTESKEQSGGPGSPTVAITWSEYVGTAGSHIIIECKILPHSSEITSSYWIFDNSTKRVVIPFRSTEGKYITGDNLNPFLQIRNLSKSDEGQYICSATNVFGTSYSNQALLSVNDDIPIVSVESILYSEYEGNAIVLGCHVDAHGSPVIFVFWEVVLNDKGSVSKIIPSHNEHDRYEGATNLNPSLMIKNLTIGDSGFYKCSAGNVFGNVSSNFTELQVLGKPPVVAIQQSDYTGNVGTNIVLHCIANSPYSQLISTKWTFLNESNAERTITPTSGAHNKYEIGDLYNPSLLIKNLTRHDAGFYKCSASNEFGTGFSNSTLLIVTGNAPYVTIPQHQYTGHVRTDAIILCVITSSDSPLNTIHWAYSNENHTKLIQHDSATEISTKYKVGDISNRSLVIHNLTQHDAGYYQCFASNVFGTGLSNYAFLTITGNPPYVTIPQEQYTGHAGTDTVIPCAIESSDSPLKTIHWSYSIENHTTLIQHDSATNISSKYNAGDVSNHSLIIYNLTQHDAGYYQCFASNVFGTGMSNYSLLTITGNAPYVTIPQQQYTGHVGADTLIPCVIESSYSPLNTIHWTYSVENHIKLIQHDSATNISTKYKVGDVSNHSLIIYNLTQNDAGNYQCFASNVFGTAMSNYTFLTITGNAPSVIIPQQQYTGHVRTDIVIPCVIKSSDSPLYTIHWAYSIKNHTTSIQHDSATNISSKYKVGDVSNHSLIIYNLTQHDAGYYQCFASNVFGIGTSNYTLLTITGNSPYVTIPQQQYTGHVGTDIAIPCVPKSSDSPLNTIHWTYSIENHTQLIQHDSATNFSTKYNVGDVSNHSLIIYNLTQHDAGYYQCFASNVFGTGMSNYTFLKITGDYPLVIISQLEYTRKVGTDIVMQCVIRSPDSHLISNHWSYSIDSHSTMIDLSMDDFNYKYKLGDIFNPSLLIHNLTKHDAGFYECSGSNTFGTGRSNRTMLIIEDPPSVAIPLQDYTALFGQPVTLTCEISSSTTVNDVFWERNLNGKITKISSRLTGIDGITTDNPALTINVTTLSDSGLYTCYAENEDGIGYSNVTQLHVIGGLPNITTHSTIVTATYGVAVMLSVSINAVPNLLYVYWTKFRNGSLETIHSGATGTLDGDRDNPSLFITFPTVSDVGIYNVYAVNALGVRRSENISLSVEGGIPIVKVESEEYTAQFGYKVTLGCNVISYPDHTTVYWEKQIGNTFTKLDSTTRGISGSTIDLPSLTINLVTSTDSGSYSCNAENAVGIGSSRRVLLKVDAGTPIVNIGSVMYTTAYGMPVTLGCEASAHPPIRNVFWQKNVNGFITTISPGAVGVQGLTPNVPNLTITFPTKSDDGEYSCFAMNDLGQRGSLPTLLKVLGDVPVLSTEVDFHKAVFGHPYTITCKVDATPIHKHVYWEHHTNGLTRKIKNDTVGVSGVSLENPSLTISFVTTSDSGAYTCFAENIIGTGISRIVQLDVKGDIPAVDVALTSISAIHGEDLSLVCSVISFPLHTNVYWKKETTEGYSILSYGTTGTIGIAVESPSLTFKPAITSDSGLYTCLASNVVGTGVSRSITVEVHPVTDGEEDVSKADGIIEKLVIAITSVFAITVMTFISGYVVKCYGFGKPKPIISLKNVHGSVVIKKGDTVILKCKNQSRIPMKNSEWYAKNPNASRRQKLDTQSQIKTDDDGTTEYFITLENVDESHEGDYTCKVQNSLMRIRMSDPVTLRLQNENRNQETTSVTMESLKQKQELAVLCSSNE